MKVMLLFYSWSASFSINKYVGAYVKYEYGTE